MKAEIDGCLYDTDRADDLSWCYSEEKYEPKTITISNDEIIKVYHEYPKKTNLDEIKEIAQAFTLIPIEETDFSPAIVHHPFTTSGIVAVNKEIVTDEGTEYEHELINICESEEEFSRWTEIMRENIRCAGNINYIFMLMSKPYYLDFLKYTKEYMSLEDLSEILAQIWTQVEYSNTNSSFTIEELVRLFEEVLPDKLMEEEDLEVFNELKNSDKEITVYRGIFDDDISRKHALSWTLSEDTAHFFATRFKHDGEKAYMLQTTIKPDTILAYFDTRNEKEVILNPNTFEHEVILKELTVNKERK